MDTTTDVQDFKRKMIPVTTPTLHRRILFLAGVVGSQTGRATTMEEIVDAGVTLLEKELGVSMEALNAN